jgi:hypothetical protein
VCVRETERQRERVTREGRREGCLLREKESHKIETRGKGSEI